MTRCQSAGIPCYNEAKYKMKIRSTSFGKYFSNDVYTVKVCEQCYLSHNPENKRTTKVKLSEEEIIDRYISKIGLTYEQAKLQVKMITDNGVTLERIATFRRYKK